MHLNEEILSISAIKKTVSTYFQRHAVEKVYLFGSYAYGLQTGKSDIDLIVCPDYQQKKATEFHQWHADLEMLFQKKVDLIINFSNDEAGRNFRFRRKIIRERIMLYEKS